MSNLKLVNLNVFKEQVESITYDDILENRFKTLKCSKTITGYGNEVNTLTCTFTMDVKVWRSYRDSGSLGHIYNADLSNYLSRKGVLNEYCVPIVSDKAPARGGRKTITVEFRLKGHPYR